MMHNDGSEHFNCREDAHLLAADADVIHREDHHPGVGNPLRKSGSECHSKAGGASAN